MIFNITIEEDASTPTPTPSPSPSPSPSPTPTPTPTIQNFSCAALPITSGSVSEAIAKAWRDGDQVPFVVWFTSYNQLPYDNPTYDIAIVDPMMQSPVPATSYALWYYYTDLGDYCEAQFKLIYGGYQTPTTSVPGTVIEEPPPPPPVMPPPVEPPIIAHCRQRITEDIQRPVDETGYILDRLKSQATGQIDYQLAQVEPAIDKITNKINSNIINTMGEVYQGAYPIGLGIPSTDQIMMGEPVYSPYGIGADQPNVDIWVPAYDPNLPYCDEPNTGGDYPVPPSPTEPPSPSPTPTPTPTPTQPPPTQPPGVSCPAPVVQCPDPPDIIFKPNIVVNIPKQDGTNVTVNVEPSPTEPSPAPSPAPAPTPTEPEPEPEEYVEEPPIPDIASPDYDKQVEAYDDYNKTPTPTTYAAAMDWSTTAPCLEFRSQTAAYATNWAHKLFGVAAAQRYKSPFDFLDIIPVVGKPMNEGLYALTSMAADVVEAIPGIIFGTAGGQAVPSFITLTLSGLLDKYLGVPALYLARGFQYDLNYLFPQTIPSETDFVNLFLSGFIDERSLECMVRANGSHYSWYKMLAGANRTRASNEQIIQLNRRGILNDEQAFAELRGNGVLEPFDRQNLYTASEAMPTVSDIVRFMVRDADDEQVAIKYGTDAALDSKYGAQLQSWAKGQGITDQVMKYYWRSHWEIPSNTALFEMFHRLRPGRNGGAIPNQVSVTAQDIKDALVVNDVLPFWAERLMEISYKPLTRTDAQRAYFIDAIDETELKNSYLDLGYNNDNADRLVRFTNQLKGKRKQATGGTEKAMAVLKYYKNFLLTDSEATARLKNGGLSDKAAIEAMSIASKQRSNDSQLACIKGVHSKYKRFIYGDNEARQDLIAIGVPIENIDKLVANWNCERGNKPKELSAAQVCKAYKNELIDEMEYLRRLQAIGYGRDEAGIIFELCNAPKNPPTNKFGTPIAAKTQAEKNAQTAAARAVTQAALEVLASQPQLPTEPPTL